MRNGEIVGWSPQADEIVSVKILFADILERQKLYVGTTTLQSPYDGSGNLLSVAAG